MKPSAMAVAAKGIASANVMSATSAVLVDAARLTLLRPVDVPVAQTSQALGDRREYV